MAIGEHASGSQVCTVTTEHTLTANPETADAVIQLFLDLDPAAVGDEFEIRIKEKAISGGTQRQMIFTIKGDQVDTLWFSPTLIVMHGWDVSIKQTLGTSRTIPWSIRKVY